MRVGREAVASLEPMAPECPQRSSNGAHVHTHAGQYHVVVANDIGEAKSAKATLTVNGPPLITLQPAGGQTPVFGGSVTFTAGAVGNPPFADQWYFNGFNNPIPGAASYPLELPNVDWDDS